MGAGLPGQVTCGVGNLATDEWKDLVCESLRRDLVWFVVERSDEKDARGFIEAVAVPRAKIVQVDAIRDDDKAACAIEPE